MMIRAALRDFQHRRRRFLVAVLGAGLVLAMSMIMSGLSDSFHHEAEHTVHLAGADGWVVAAGAAGPFTTSSLIDDEAVAAVRAADGVAAAEPILISRQAVATSGEPVFSILVGVRPGRLGSPDPDAGTALVRNGEAVVDRRLDAAPGDTIHIAGRPFTVSGTVRATLFAATPVVYVSLADAREIGLEGAELSSAVLLLGTPTRVPDGLKTMTPAAAVADAMEPLKSASGTIAMVRTLLWLVAALIVGSVLYLNALERTRDIAVFKAVGASSSAIAAGLALQAMLVALLASVVAAGLATLLAPVFPMPVHLSLSLFLVLPAVALSISLVGAAGGMRRAVTVPPALAFGAM
jgi:putative ABC transport system permease protein